MPVTGTDTPRIINSNSIPADVLINLDHGDPTVFEGYWRKMGDKCRVVMEGYEMLSYFSGAGGMLGKVCWYMDAMLEEQIRRLHRTVGNAAEEGYHVVVGTGSSQLILAAFSALSPSNQQNPKSIVCAAPYYSSYPEMADFLKSGLYKWAGDACTFDKDEPYIEIITSPNNPDGHIRHPVVKKTDQGKLVYDLAYYWPQYTPITTSMNSDIMLFTASKCTGHAGSRIGWALVKDKDVAQRMVKFIELSTIGVSRESQLRTAKILEVISDSCQNTVESPKIENFFMFGKKIMSDRWQRLENVVKEKKMLSLAKYPVMTCNFTGEKTETHPAFAWMKASDSIGDCQKLLREKNIATRSGSRFGSDPSYTRISTVSRDEEFDAFLERVNDIKVVE